MTNLMPAAASFFYVCYIQAPCQSNPNQIKKMHASAFMAPATQLSASCEWRFSCTACRHRLTTLSDSSPQVTLRNTSQLFAAKHCAAAHRCVQDGATAITSKLPACIGLFCLHMHDSRSPIRHYRSHSTNRRYAIAKVTVFIALTDIATNKSRCTHTIAQRTLHAIHRHHVRVHQV